MDIRISILTVTLAFAAAVITPGPNFLVAARNSVTYSRHTGFYTALGIACATLLHITAGFVGLTTLIWKMTWLFTALKIFGAAYLIYLGFRTFSSRSNRLSIDCKKSTIQFRKTVAFRMGFYTCISNPKSALFYLSLFTVIIPANTPFWAQAVMTIIMISISIGWYGSVAVFFSHARVQNLYGRIERSISYLVGGLLIGLGLRIALARE